MKLKKIDLNAMMEVSFIFAFPIFLYLWKVVHVVVYVFLLFVTFCILGMFLVYRRIRSIKSN